MNKVYLGEIDDVTTQHLEGSLPKFWVEQNGQKYLFKNNLCLPFREESPTDMGEVLYSVLGKRFGVPCVEADFASYEKNGKEVNGVLIKSYYNHDYEFSVNYSEMVAEIQESHSHALSGNVQTALEVAKKYSTLHKYSINIRKASSQLKKQSILDFFLNQEDRSICNVGFIANQDVLRLAPVFDNGFCLSFAKPSNINQFWTSLTKRGFGYTNLLSNFHFSLKPMPTLEYEQENIKQICQASEESRNIKQICQASEESRKIRKFVGEILDIDLAKELNKLESVRQIPLKKPYKKVANALFERRKDLFLTAFESQNREF